MSPGDIVCLGVFLDNNNHPHHAARNPSNSKEVYFGGTVVDNQVHIMEQDAPNGLYFAG
jgi:acetyltransferase-like isoleucine patch superfamily enzyme